MSKQKNIKKSDAFVEQLALAEVALALAAALDESGLSQKELAQRMGISEARISQILCADHNLTVKTFARLAAALDRQLKFELPQLADVTSPAIALSWQSGDEESYAENEFKYAA